MTRQMRWEALVKFLLAMALGMAGVASPRLVGTAYAMQITTTTVADRVYHADGTAAAGTVLINWATFTTMSGEVIQGGSESTTLGAGGALSVSLVPNVGATPIGTYYTVVYHLDDGSVQKEYWVVPVSTASVTIATVKNTVLPMSVAMQTVSKSYVDTAIAVAVTGHPLDSSPYVVKAGDTMTGPLLLPADPVSANQAADKHYVDAGVAGVSSGLGGKVATLPSATQVVTQPAGTDLETNRLNGVEYASQYATVANSNGIANATSATDCTGAGAAGAACVVMVEPSVTGGENFNSKAAWGYQTHVKDQRRGAQQDIYLNPEDATSPQNLVGQVIDVTTTESTQALAQATGIQELNSSALEIHHKVLAGGSNLFSEELGSVPYFKTNYVGLSVDGTYNTAGQHILGGMTTSCFAVGDCLIGSQTLRSSGGYRDSADEGTHPFDIQITEDGRVFQGTCATGCTTGSQSLTAGSQANGGTQGDGRYLIDKNPAGVISTGVLTGGTNGTIHPTATFTGTSFPVSTFFATAALIPSQAHNTAPGTVTVAIATAGLPAGFSTNTAASPSSSGVACVAAESSTLPNHEMAPYTVIDGTHLQMTLLKPHGAGSTIAIGGLCGYGLEQTVDTENGIRQVFPVIGSYAATGLYYAGANTQVVGQSGTTSAYTNVNLSIVSAVRSGNMVTVTTASGVGSDVNGLTMTVAGVTDSSYNGNFAVTTTGSTTLTYAETGPNSTSTGGTISFVTGGYALYPMAEVLSVYDPATKSVDGLFSLAPNTVAWAAGDALEQPHYFQIVVAADTSFVTQSQPRPRQYSSPGYAYLDNVGPGMRGFEVQNLMPATSYFGNGGTHSYPDIAYLSAGIWSRTFDAQAGERSVFSLHCNAKGCNRWNSGYDLFELDSSAGVDVVNYAPQSSTWTMSLRGTGYSFTPLAFTAGTANITTLNATTVNAGTMTLGAVSSTSEATGALTATSVASTGALSGSSLTTGAITATSETLTGTSTTAAVNTGVVTATTLNGALSAANVTSGTLSAARLPVMGASGGLHAAGAVPDPGATAGATRYLREDGTWVSPAGGVTAFNSRTGAVAPASGDYSVAQVTGAAPLASPALTGTPTAPTATALDNSTKVATTAYVDGAQSLDLKKANNLSDVANAAAARANLGISSGLTHVVAPDVEYGFIAGTTSTTTENDISGSNSCSGAPCNGTFAGTGTVTRVPTGGIQFPNTFAYLNTPLTTWKTIVARVCPYIYPNLGTLSAPNYLGLWGTTGGTGANVMLGANYAQGQYSFSPGIYNGNFTTNYTYAVDQAGGCHTYGIAADTVTRLTKDGYELTYGAQVAPGSTTASAGTYALGAGNSLNSGFFLNNSYVMYFLGWKTTVLTDAQLLAETNYENYHAGPDPYVATTGTSHTATNTTIGDSITVGVGTSPSFVFAQNLALNNTYSEVISATGGDYACEIAANYPYRAAAWTQPNAPLNNVVFFNGTNDNNAARPAADIFACVKQEVMKAKAQGAARVYVMTMQDRGGTLTTLRAGKNAFNTLLRQNALQLGYYLIDDAQDARLGADGASNSALTNCPGSLPCFNTDVTHDTNAGAALLQVAEQTIINATDGSSVNAPDAVAGNSMTLTAANNYTVWSGLTATGAAALNPCLYMTGSQYARTINNLSGTFSIGVTSSVGDTISGNVTVAPSTVAVFTPMLTSAAAGGCSWLRTN